MNELESKIKTLQTAHLSLAVCWCNLKVQYELLNKTLETVLEILEQKPLIKLRLEDIEREN